MPIPIIPKPEFPLIPKVAGVPAVLRSAGQILNTLTSGLIPGNEIVNSLIGSEPVRWGVFGPSGTAIAQYDSVASVSYRNNTNISEYPIEQGSFASYNKVDNPFNITVLLSKGGNETDRNTFTNDLRDALHALTLYTVITEDGTFRNCNLQNIDWQREATNGAHMIRAYCEFTEIRQRGTTAFSQTADPSGADPQNNGQVQAIDDSVIDTSGIA